MNGLNPPGSKKLGSLSWILDVRFETILSTVALC